MSHPRCALALLALLAASACSMAENYPDPAGPRFAGDHRRGDATPSPRLRVVTYNLAFGEALDTALAALRTPALADPDVLLLQEMDADGVDRLARELGHAYVYFPASVQRDGDDFGNAVLSRFALADDRKLVLPYRDPYNDRLRTATLARLDVGGTLLSVASVHNGTLTVGVEARLRQAEVTLEALEAWAGPALVGGDFNTSDPKSLTQTVGLLEARGWAWASEGAGPTVDGVLGKVALDHVFTRGLGPTRGAAVFTGPSGSDHQPLRVDVGWAP
jgi:endonuclease/exonuclease/phosphatase family metal-dependent hydrolase